MNRSLLYWGLGAAGVVGLIALVSHRSAAPAPLPNPNGKLPFTVDPSGFAVVQLTPGNMGTLTTQSLVSAADLNSLPAVNIQAIGGAILNVTSTNSDVMPGMAGSSTTGGLALGSALSPGTAVLTVSWVDRSRTPQTSTFTVVAS